MKKGFTLVELIIVIVVLGILATLAVPQFTRTQENAFDREANANLQLIKAAEKIYRVEIGAFWARGNTADINAGFRLEIPMANWNYQVCVGGGDFSAIATPTQGTARKFFIKSTTDVAAGEPANPVCP